MSEDLHETSGVVEKIATGGPGCILSSIRNRFLYERSANWDVFCSMVDRYISSAGIPKNTRALASVRANVRNEVMADSLMWPSFIKCMLFFGFRQIWVGISFEDKKGEMHYIEICNPFDRKELNQSLFYGNDKTFRKSNKEDSDKIPKEETILSRLSEAISEKINDSGATEESLMADYVGKMFVGKKKVPDVSQLKGSLKKEFKKVNMSWRTFIKRLSYLGIDYFAIKVSGLNYNNIVETVGFGISNNSVYGYSRESKEEENEKPNGATEAQGTS